MIKKATATPMKINDYCYVLNPEADNQSMKFAFKYCIWTGPYIVVKVLSNNNYVVRRTGTRYTQSLHRICLRLYAPNQRVPDVTVKVGDQLPDPEVKTTHDDWYAQAWETEIGEVLFGNSSEKANEEATITEVTTHDVTTTESEAAITTAVETSTENNISPGDSTTFIFDVSDNPYIRTLLIMESPPIPPNIPPIVIGYNPRKTGRYNLRPNLRPNAHPDFRMLDAIITEESSQTQR